MQDKKQNILFISYVFPPTGGAGVQRTVKLVKYFHKLGWNVSVLTAKNPSVPVFDEKILKDVPKDVKIYRSLTFEIPYKIKRKLWNKSISGKVNEETTTESKKSLSSVLKQLVKGVVHRLMLPDPQIGWNFTALRTARKIIKRDKIDFVFISAPPFSSLMLIPQLKNSTAKLVADFRDEWTEFYLKSYDFHKKNDKLNEKITSIENDVINSADLITMATHQFVDNYQQKYQTKKEKIKTLTNGYDPDDFIFSDVIKKNNSSVFNIVYTGTVFNVTTLRYFLDAFEVFLKENKIEKKIILTIVGRITEEELVWFDKFPFQENLNILGYITHQESVAQLRMADLLLVVVDDIVGSERIIAAKVFEYIYVMKPILALVPTNGEVAQIVNETASGTVLSNRDVQGITVFLEKIITGENQINSNKSVIEKYSREVIAKNLIQYLQNI